MDNDYIDMLFKTITAQRENALNAFAQVEAKLQLAEKEIEQLKNELAEKSISLPSEK